MTETAQERTAREWLNALGAEKDADTAVSEAMAKLESAKANTLKAYEAMKLAFSAEPPLPLNYEADDLAEDIREMQSQEDNQGVYGVGPSAEMIKQIREFGPGEARFVIDPNANFNETYGFTGLGQTSDPIRYDPD